MVTGDKCWGFPAGTTAGFCGGRLATTVKSFKMKSFKVKGETAGACGHLQRHPGCCMGNKRVTVAANASAFLDGILS